MKPHATLAALILTAATGMLAPGCVAPVGPVEVTRFHTPALASAGRGVISVEPMSGQSADSLEYRSYAAAVARQLTLIGYREAAPGANAALVAQMRFERRTVQPERAGGPVSVGVGGGGGSFGSGVGVGLGIDLSGRPKAQTETLLAVTIRDRSSGQALWEGRSTFTVAASSPLAQTQLGAAKMAEALFKGFPGQSGETIVAP